MNKELEIVFSNRLTEAMANASLDEHGLAGRIHCSAKEIENYLEARLLPRMPRFKRIADELNVSMDWLAGRS